VQLLPRLSPSTSAGGGALMRSAGISKIDHRLVSLVLLNGLRDAHQAILPIRDRARAPEVWHPGPHLRTPRPASIRLSVFRSLRSRLLDHGGCQASRSMRWRLGRVRRPRSRDPEQARSPPPRARRSAWLHRRPEGRHRRGLMLAGRERPAAAAAPCPYVAASTDREQDLRNNLIIRCLDRTRPSSGRPGIRFGDGANTIHRHPPFC
jgi:hypothetical protein